MILVSSCLVGLEVRYNGTHCLDKKIRFSPSCGSSMIYNGEFKGKKIVGNGVTTALLRKNGIQVVSEERVTDFLQEKI